MNLVATAFMQDYTGFSSSHFMTYITTIIMYLAPILFPCFGKEPIKFMSQVSNVRLGIMGRRGISFFCNGQPILWKASHWAILFLQSLFIFGHHRPDWRISLMVVSTKKCPSIAHACASCMMSCISCSKTHRGRTSSNPNLYKDPLINVKGVALMVKIFFLFSE